MYARAITLPIQPGKVDQAIEVFGKTIAPMFKQQKGFIDGYLLGDGKTGNTVSLTLWDTEANASAVETSGFYQKWVAMLSDIMTGPSVREQNEVYLRY